MPATRTRFPSPAALALAAAGVSQYQVAERIRSSDATISRQLSGSLKLQPETLAAIRQLAGVDCADQIAAIHGTALVSS